MQSLEHLRAAFVALARWFLRLTHHHQLHQPEHVGPYAGSLLRREDWDHAYGPQTGHGVFIPMR